jgi:hypothetical protein
MAHGDAREGKWRGNWQTEWVANILHTTADAHTSAASRRLNWRPCRFKWTRPFRRKTISGFCACGITFQRQSTLFYVSFKVLIFRAFSNDVNFNSRLYAIFKEESFFRIISCGLCCCIFKYSKVMDLKYWKMKATRSFETSGTFCPAT